jgi:hypothetical protein
MAVYPDSVKYEVYIGSSWVDISADIIGTDACSYGISGNTPLDRVASAGNLELTLRNDSGCIGGASGYYSPNRTGSLPGWTRGLQLRQTITYLGLTFIKRWHLTEIKPGSGFDEIVKVKASDWIEYAATHPIILPALKFDQKIENVVADLVALMPIQPSSTTYGSGTDTFATAFDMVRSETKALSEFGKVAQSELGYIYMRREDTLVVEGRNTRTGHDEVVEVPDLADGGALLMEDGSYLLAEDGSKILLDIAAEAIVDNIMQDADISFGDNLANYVSMKSYPRAVDAAATTVLFTLNSPLQLAAGETKTLKGNFRDPAGGAQGVAGTNMVAPVATTDYLLNTARDGSGTNMTVYLTVVAEYGANDVFYTLTNTAGLGGYVTKLQARGKGIYTYDPVEYIASDTTSINSQGYKPLQFTMKYQDSPDNAAILGDVILAQQKTPRMILNSITFLANYNPSLMSIFIKADIGDLIYIKEDQNGITGYYYIQHIKYDIAPGELIHCTYTVVEALALGTAYWELGTAGYSELGTTTVLGY